MLASIDFQRQSSHHTGGRRLMARCMKNFHFLTLPCSEINTRYKSSFSEKSTFIRGVFISNSIWNTFSRHRNDCFNSSFSPASNLHKKKKHEKAKNYKADILSEGSPKMDWDKLSSASPPPRRLNKGDICSAWWESTQHNKPWNLILFLQLYLYLYLLVFVFVFVFVSICICICNGNKGIFSYEHKQTSSTQKYIERSNDWKK